MDNSIYEVTRDEYVGLVGEINPKYSYVETFCESQYTVIKIKSKTGVHYTTRIIYEDGTEQYFIFNLPKNEERLPAKIIRKITLKTKSDAQAFFNILSSIQKEKK